MVVFTAAQSASGSERSLQALLHDATLSPVIQDARPWKEELVDEIERCELSWTEHPDRSIEWLTLQAERAVFLSAFIIRKLMDSGKLAPEVESLNVRVGVSPATVMPSVEYLSWDALDQHYDFDMSVPDKDLSLRRLVS